MLKRLSYLVAMLFLATSLSLAADETGSVLQIPCDSSACNPSKSDLKKAEAAFSKGLKLEKEKHIDQAYDEFDTAARLAPKNVNYLTALAITREERVSDLIKKGSSDLEAGHAVEAQGELRAALSLDPGNQFAQQRLQDSLGEWAPKIPAGIKVVEDSGEIRISPSPTLADFHFRGDSRALLTQVASAYGITLELDDSVVSRRVHFDLDQADFYTAMRAAGEVTNTFWAPLSDKQIVVARDSQDNHRQFDRMALRTFKLDSATTAQELQEITNLLRVIFDSRFVQQQPQTGTITARMPADTLDAATEVLENLGKARPQVMLDISVYEIDHQFTREMGLHLPNNFELFNIPAAAIAAIAGLGGQNLQSLINQLISSGGINQANSQAISGLLAQLQGQGTSIFSTPLATFGGGLTFMGLSLDQLTAQLSLNESWARLLDHAILRGSQANDVTFKIGQRYPVINASFAPIYNSTAISQVLQNGSFQAPIPSFQYEDLGLDMKAKPAISPHDVRLDLELKLRSLAGQSVNGVPVIANREYKGSINLLDGEQAIVASEVSVTEQRTLTGIPGLGSIPGLNQVASTSTNMQENDEIMIVITPHIVALPAGETAEVWLQR